MNTDILILRETDNLPLINKDDTLTSAELDGNFINIYNDFLSLSIASDITLVYHIGRSYLIGEYTTYDGRMWIATSDSTASSPYVGSVDWLDVFPTILAHEKNKDTILDEGGTNETTVAEIRAFIDAGLTSTTNLSLSTKTASSFKIESSTGSDVTIPQATNVEAGLLNATDKVKLDNTTGINTGDQSLVSLNAEDVDNKVTDFTTINNTLYPTTQAVDTYITAQIPDLVDTFLSTNVELNTNKATTFTVINDILYPSVKAVDDQLDLKVDKGIAGERLITVAEATKLSNTSGTNTGDQIISDATITTTDITTNNVSSTKHGFAPKTPNNTTTFLRGDGTWATPSAGGLTYFSEAQSTSATNTPISADSLTAVSATASADFIVKPKGVGAFIVGHIPEFGSFTDGNKRGNYAIDIQPASVGFYSRVASGTSAIAIGYQIIASGNYSTAIGAGANSSGANAMSFVGNSNNGASGDSSLLLGSNGDGNCTASGTNSVSISGGYATAINSFAQGGSTASGTQSVAMGGNVYGRALASGVASCAIGENNIADARSSVALGIYGATKGVAQRLSLGTFQDVLPYLKGSSQLSLSSSTITTTTNTVGELVAYNGTAINLVLQNNEAIRVKGSIIGKQTASTNVSSYDFDCIVVRGTTAASTILPLSNVNLVLDTIVLDTIPTLTANTTLGGLSVKSGAKTTTTIKWSCRIDSTEVILA